VAVYRALQCGLSVDEIKRQVMEPEEVAIDYQI
jgi:hypothetical protein